MNRATIEHELMRSVVDEMPADSLSPARQDALTRFSTRGFPTPRHEDWRYTNLSRVIERSNEWLQDQSGNREAQPVEAPHSDLDAYWITIANGSVADIAAEISDLGITACRLSQSTATAALDTTDPLSSFNAALLKDGLYLRVADNADIDKPIGIQVTDSPGSRASVNQVRVIVDLGRNSRLRLIENYPHMDATNSFTNTVVQLNIAEGARADILRIHDASSEHLQVGRLIGTVARDATLRCLSLDFGGGLVRNDIAIDINAPGADVGLYGLYLAGGRQHTDNHIRVDHRVGPAVSNVEYRGVLNDRAQCVFNGKAVVHAGADGTDARQSNHNLLLSETAEVDTKPELEIYADDVKCSHGATVGQLDKSALFYLRSRGLDRDHAARVLTNAFAASVLRDLPIESARQPVEDMLMRRLGKLTAGSRP